MNAIERDIAGDQFRRDWASHSGDWAFGVANFLQSGRQHEISADEILRTQVYARSTPREKDALRWFVAQSDARPVPPTEEDHRRLVERDTLVIQYADQTVPLGRGRLVEPLAKVPAAVERARAVDANLFGKNVFPEPEIFGWVFKR